MELVLMLKSKGLQALSHTVKIHVVYIYSLLGP